MQQIFQYANIENSVYFKKSDLIFILFSVMIFANPTSKFQFRLDSENPYPVHP